MDGKYELPKLDYDYDELEPHISEEQLKVHHTKHHQGYVNKANKLIEKLENARTDGEPIKDLIQNLTFNISGHIMHSLFWKNMSPNGGGQPSGKIKEVIENEFGSFERFKKEFTEAASSIKGSGWAALAYCQQIGRPIVLQMEQHNNFVIPSFRLIMVLDMWEHAFYIDHKSEKAKFVDAFWNVVNWEEINNWLDEVT